jgi:two-component sensor histidine kinase
MVVNELLLNAVEHGLKDRAQGTIRILLEDLGDAVQIEVVDDGAGLPTNFDPAQIGQTLGLQIVQTLVTDDLKGSVAAGVDPGRGAVSPCRHLCPVTLPETQQPQRVTGRLDAP